VPHPYRATTDLDVVDRLLGELPQLPRFGSLRGWLPSPLFHRFCVTVKL
jgi:hypothetical protein